MICYCHKCKDLLGDSNGQLACICPAPLPKGGIPMSHTNSPITHSIASLAFSIPNVTTTNPQPGLDTSYLTFAESNRHALAGLLCSGKHNATSHAISLNPLRRC